LPWQGGPDQPATWGPWLRLLPVTITSPKAHTLMNGPDGLPLLVVDRVGKGRVGVLLSDSLWLWARGWQGGGPQAELVRRLAHWLMAEPDLEEDSLRAHFDSGQLSVERRSLDPHTTPTVTVTAPDGTHQTLTLQPAGPGLWQGHSAAPQAGLWTVSDGQRQAAAAVADPDPLENGAVVATANPLRPLVEASGGGVVWLAEGAAERGGLPQLRRINSESRQRTARTTPPEQAWMGLRANNATLTIGYQQTSLLPASLLALLLLATLLITWRQEGR
jgi:hypothetical protein